MGARRRGSKEPAGIKGGEDGQEQLRSGKCQEVVSKERLRVGNGLLRREAVLRLLSNIGKIQTKFWGGRWI